jgi:hypothetical protein
MSNEPLGLYEELAANRAKYAARAYIPPHDRLERRVATVAPKGESPPTIAGVSARLAAMTLQITAKTKEIADLDVRIADKKRELHALGDRRKVPTTIIEVQETFCGVLRDGGYLIEDRPYTFNDLVCRTNRPPHTEARHICMDLVRRLTMATLASIASSFGYSDHTTVRYALARARVYMAANPMLADVHAKVLAHFEGQK